MNPSYATYCYFIYLQISFAQNTYSNVIAWLDIFSTRLSVKANLPSKKMPQTMMPMDWFLSDWKDAIERKSHYTDFSSNEGPATFEERVLFHCSAIRTKSFSAGKRKRDLTSKEYQHYVDILQEIRVAAAYVIQEDRLGDKQGLLTLVQCMLIWEPHELAQVRFDPGKFKAWWPDRWAQLNHAELQVLATHLNIGKILDNGLEPSFLSKLVSHLPSWTAHLEGSRSIS